MPALEDVAGIAITVYGAKELTNFFNQMGGRLKNDTPYLSAINQGIISPFLKERFDSEGSAFGKSWAELRPRTQEERAEQGYGPAHPIGVRTGEMKKGILNPEKSPFGIYELSPNLLKTGTSDPKAVQFHLGTDIQQAREIYMIPKEIAKSITVAYMYMILSGRMMTGGGGSIFGEVTF